MVYKLTQGSTRPHTMEYKNHWKPPRDWNKMPLIYP